MVTGKQIRAARGLLGWSAQELAKHCAVTRETINRIEDGSVTPREGTLSDIVSVFADERVEFIDHQGVRIKDDTLTVIEGENPYLRLLDDVFHTLHAGDEVLFAFVCNRLSTPKVIESDLRMRRSGLRFRSLIEEGDTYCLYPITEYRWQPTKFFQNSTQVIYGNKVASMIGGNKKAVIIHNKDYAETQRKLFNGLWENGTGPQLTTATVQYD